MSTSIFNTAQSFFLPLNGASEVQRLLGELNQKFEFQLTDDETFYLEVKDGKLVLCEGQCEPHLKDTDDITRLEMEKDTLMKIFWGEVRYSDALIPSRPDIGTIRMIENWQFKKGAINWLGRLIRLGQEPACMR